MEEGCVLLLESLRKCQGEDEGRYEQIYSALLKTFALKEDQYLREKERREEEEEEKEKLLGALVIKASCFAAFEVTLLPISPLLQKSLP